MNIEELLFLLGIIICCVAIGVMYFKMGRIWLDVMLKQNDRRYRGMKKLRSLNTEIDKVDKLWK